MAVQVSCVAHCLTFDGNSWEIPKGMLRVVDGVSYLHMQATCQPLIRLCMGKDKIPKNSSMAGSETIKNLKIERNILRGRLPLPSEPSEQDDAVNELFDQGDGTKRRRKKYSANIASDIMCEVQHIKMLAPSTNVGDLYVQLDADNLALLFGQLKDEGDELLSNKKAYNKSGAFVGVAAAKKSRRDPISEASSSNE